MSLEANQRSYRDLATSFCEILERPTADLAVIRSHLIALYSASLQMPEMADVAFEDLPERIPSGEYSKIQKGIATELPLDLFSVCFHPFRSPPETPVWASISDGLADIWWDLKRGLVALEEDEGKWAAAVFWDWKFSFESHWGDHAVETIWAIHMLLRDHPPQKIGVKPEPAT